MASVNSPDMAAAQRASRQLVLCRDAHPAARAARGDVRDLFVLPRRSTTSPIRPGRATSGWRALAALARRYRRALCAASRRRGSQGSRAPSRRFGLRREDFLAVIDGMEMDVRRRHPRAGPEPRSISIATASPARSDGCRCGCSACEEATASRSPIISAARCNSPTSCATSTRTPAIGRLYLPREALRLAGIASDDPQSRSLSIPRARPGLRAARRARARAFREGRRDHGAQSAPRGARAAHHGRSLSRDPRPADRARLGAAARSRCASASRG